MLKSYNVRHYTIFPHKPKREAAGFIITAGGKNRNNDNTLLYSVAR